MIRDGDPEVLTPDLFASMSRFEQKQIRNYFGRRLDEEGRGFPNRPDDEAPSVVARRAYLQGTWVVYLLWSAPFIVVGPLLFSFFAAGEHDALTVGGLVVCVAGCGFFMAKWGVRARRINGYFATFPGGGEGTAAPEAPTARANDRDVQGIPRSSSDRSHEISAMERGRIVGGVSGVLIIWILWLAFGFTLGVAIATTAVLVVSMASAYLLRGSRLRRHK